MTAEITIRFDDGTVICTQLMQLPDIYKHNFVAPVIEDGLCVEGYTFTPHIKQLQLIDAGRTIGRG